MFSIRYAVDEDIPAILDVLKPYNMHQVPSPEMPELLVRHFYIAEVSGKVVGAAGYTFLSPETGKTTLLGVDPAYAGKGIGLALQARRMAAMRSLGCQRVITNADRPETIRWYQKHFGYKYIGTIKKLHPFGLPGVDHWTTLEADLRSLDFTPYLQNGRKPPLIINAAITGAVHSKKDNPHLPATPGEIIDEAEKVADAGAAVVHLHARDQSGKPTMDPQVYERIISAIRKRCPGLIICVSTTGRFCLEPVKRAAVLSLAGDARPDLASLTPGSFNFPNQASINEPETIRYLLAAMKKSGIKPEVETFDLGMLDYARHLIQRGLLELPLYVNTLLGSLGTLAAREENAVIMRDALPVDTCWSVAGIGRYQSRMMEWAARNGAHIRTGLEDNLFAVPEKRIHTTNTALVTAARKLAEAAGRPAASPREARRLLNLN